MQKVSLEPCCCMFSVFCYLDILNCIKMQIFFSKKEKTTVYRSLSTSGSPVGQIKLILRPWFDLSLSNSLFLIDLSCLAFRPRFCCLCGFFYYTIALIEKKHVSSDISPKNENYPMIYSPSSHPRYI